MLPDYEDCSEWKHGCGTWIRFDFAGWGGWGEWVCAGCGEGF